MRDRPDIALTVAGSEHGRALQEMVRRWVDNNPDDKWRVFVKAPEWCRRLTIAVSFEGLARVEFDKNKYERGEHAIVSPLGDVADYAITTETTAQC